MCVVTKATSPATIRESLSAWRLYNRPTRSKSSGPAARWIDISIWRLILSIWRRKETGLSPIRWLPDERLQDANGFTVRRITRGLIQTSPQSMEVRAQIRNLDGNFAVIQ